MSPRLCRNPIQYLEMTQNIPESRGRSLEINTRFSVRFFFVCLFFYYGTYFILSRKEVAKKTGWWKLVGPSFAQLLLDCSSRVMGGNLKPCWLHREAWGGGRGVQNVNFFKKKSWITRKGRWSPQAFRFFSGCLFSSDAVIGRPRGRVLVLDALGRPQVLGQWDWGPVCMHLGPEWVQSWEGSGLHEGPGRDVRAVASAGGSHLDSWPWMCSVSTLIQFELKVIVSKG